MRRLRWSVTGVAILGLAACGQDVDSGLEPAGYRVSVPGELIGRFPPDPTDQEAKILIESAFGLAVRDESIFVLDVLAKRVYHLDLDAHLQAVLGRPGEGPGELATPVSLQVDEGGDVWIADPQQDRLARFHPDGERVDEISPPHPVVNFTVAGGRVWFLTLNSETLLSALDESGNSFELSIDPGMVPDRVNHGPLDRFSLRVLDLAVLSPDTFLLFRNKHSTDFFAWRVALGPERDRIVDVRPLPLPGWLYTMIEEETELIREQVSKEWATGDFFVPFKSARVVAGTVWLAPGPSGRVIAVSLPNSPGDSASVILPSGDEAVEMLDAAVVGDRLVALYATEVRVYQLERVTSGRFEPPE